MYLAVFVNPRLAAVFAQEVGDFGVIISDDSACRNCSCLFLW